MILTAGQDTVIVPVPLVGLLSSDQIEVSTSVPRMGAAETALVRATPFHLTMASELGSWAMPTMRAALAHTATFVNAFQEDAAVLFCATPFAVRVMAIAAPPRGQH